jgi:hypothetical protein
MQLKTTNYGLSREKQPTLDATKHIAAALAGCSDEEIAEICRPYPGLHLLVVAAAKRRRHCWTSN